MPKPFRLDSLSVFSPCFNEAENIDLLISQYQKLLPQIANDYQIIIVDDGSTDQTGIIADKLAKSDPHLEIIHHPKNLGYGASLQSGFQAAKYQWTFFTDGDLQFDLNQLREFIPHTLEHPVIIGFRTKRADGSLRAINAWIFKRFIDLLFRVHVKDIDCAFKLIRTDLLKSITLRSTGAMISAELLYLLKKKHIKFYQIPVIHYPRKYGQPTGNHPKVILKAGVEAIRIYLNIKLGLG